MRGKYGMLFVVETLVAYGNVLYAMRWHSTAMAADMIVVCSAYARHFCLLILQKLKWQLRKLTMNYCMPLRAYRRNRVLVLVG